MKVAHGQGDYLPGPHPSFAGRDYYLIDGSGRLLGIRNMNPSDNPWTWYANGLDRVAKFKLDGALVEEVAYYEYDHLGNTRSVYEAGPACVVS